MKSIVLGVTGASAQFFAERSIDLLLQSNHEIDLVLSKGAYEVWNAEYNIHVPVDTIKQELFWRDRLNLSLIHI